MTQTSTRRWSSTWMRMASVGILSSSILSTPLWADEQSDLSSPIAEQSATDVSLTYPGRPKEEVVQFLQETMTKYQEGQKPLENIFVKGQLSREATPYSPGTKEVRPEPKWYEFLYAAKNGHRRFQRNYTQWASDGALTFMLYRHMEPDTIYKLDGPSLALYAMEHSETRWDEMVSEVSGFQLYYDIHDRKWQRADEFLKNAIERIDTGWELFEGVYSLKCQHDSGETRITYCSQLQSNQEFKDDVSGIYFSDLAGGAVVKSHYTFGNPTTGVHNTFESSLKLQEIAPGVFYPKTASSLSFLGGTGPVRNGFAGWVRNDLQVDSVEFGDFTCEESVLTAKGLPIPVGTNVEDYRQTPVKLYTFGRSPLEETILQEAVVPKTRWKQWRVVLSLAVVVAVLALVIGQRKSAA